MDQTAGSRFRCKSARPNLRALRLAAEDLVEGVAELGVAVVDEKAERLLYSMRLWVPAPGQPVSAGADRPPLKQSQLVAQEKDLDLLLALREEAQNEQLEQLPQRPVKKRQNNPPRAARHGR
jgi:hypothetical protein